jgi:hypothetical protein
MGIVAPQNRLTYSWLNLHTPTGKAKTNKLAYNHIQLLYIMKYHDISQIQSLAYLQTI